MTANCRYVGSTQPRFIPGRHLPDCECDGTTGCLPCEEHHCVVCGREHAKAACPACLGDARDDLRAIGELTQALPTEAREKGVDSEAMMLTGPAANPEAWQHAAMSAIRGRLCHCGSRGRACPSLVGGDCPDILYLEDNRDEQHPDWILPAWEQEWRGWLQHHTEAPATPESTWTYLDTQIGYMAEQLEPDFGQFARELRACRAYLENVLHDGIREERGAPCVQCGTKMTRIITKQGAQDLYRCVPCRREVTSDQYYYAVGVVYRAHALHLTAQDLGDRLGIKPSVIRVWGARGQIRKHGRTAEGVTLYDVADAQAKRDGLAQEAG